MSLQDDINADVAAIMAALSAAQGVGLSETAVVNLEPVRVAFQAQQDQINALETRIAALEGTGGSPGEAPDVADAEVDLSDFKAASEAVTAAGAGLADLLITQSNYDGSQQ